MITKEIAAEIGKIKKTAKKALSKLEENELIFQSEEDVFEANIVDVSKLNEIAEEKGTLGISDKRHLQHKKEREDYAYYQLTGGKSGR